mmetsp:Transcript_22125/g.52285  ORF Transcript_22125/g.52285 Transcript_22125/m.52285 type:complete len:106 (-) Transcript_22125:458-775(-)
MTYRNALTLKNVLPMLVSPSTANCAGGIVDGFSARAYRPTEAVIVYSSDVTKRKESSCKCFPPDVANSSRSPYATKDPMIPKKQNASQKYSLFEVLDCVASFVMF